MFSHLAFALLLFVTKRERAWRGEFGSDVFDFGLRYHGQDLGFTDFTFARLFVAKILEGQRL